MIQITAQMRVLVAIEPVDGRKGLTYSHRNRSGQNSANRGTADLQRRAISDLLTPARCSFRISAACVAAVAGRPSRFPFSRA